MMEQEALLLKSLGQVNRFSMEATGELLLKGKGISIRARR